LYGGRHGVADDSEQNDAVFTVTGQPTLMQVAEYFAEVLGSPETLKKLETALSTRKSKQRLSPRA
jgi:hypothetical protein